MSMTLLFTFLSGLLPVSCVMDVTTKYGVVTGQTLTLGSGKQIHSFLGVPYAAAPSGAMRWKPPVEPTAWSSPFKANAYGNMCPQDGLFIGMTHPFFDKFDEDCLQLNIYTPAINLSRKALYPVMVYFHGGAYSVSGSIQFPGHFIAERDVVVVIANYRLGILGFMTTADDAVTPNLGLLDQRQSLVLVQENIRAFGGDPDSVTIFGQSAGASSVGLHLMSPKSTGLFHRAICQSGNELAHWAYGRPEQKPELAAFSVAAKLGCNTTNTIHMVDCLRDIDAETLINTQPDDYTNSPFFKFSPVVDGDNGFLSDKPEVLRFMGRFNKVPLMAGIMREDGALFVPLITEDVLDGGFNRSEYERHLHEFVSGFFTSSDSYRRELVYRAMYHQYTNFPHLDDLEGNRQSFVQFTTDLMFGYPNDLQAKDQSQYEDTYMYIFGYISSNASEILPEWAGATHGFDISYVFGLPQLRLNPAVLNETQYEATIDFNHEDVQYSQFIITLITNFAKTGNPTPVPLETPGGGRLITWPAFDMHNLNYLMMDRGKEVVDSYRQQEYRFWTGYVPWLLDHTYPNNETFSALH